MNDSERLEMLIEAIGLIEEAQQLVDDALDGTPEESHYKAYGRYGLDTLLGNGNPYDRSLEDLIAKYEEMEDNSRNEI